MGLERSIKQRINEVKGKQSAAGTVDSLKVAQMIQEGTETRNATGSDEEGYWLCQNPDTGELHCSCGRPIYKVEEGVYRCSAGYPQYKLSAGEVGVDKFGNIMLKAKPHTKPKR